MIDLKTWRNGVGLTQGAAADRFGVSQSAWANYESGQREPPQAVLDAVQKDSLAIITAMTARVALSVPADPAPPTRPKAIAGDPRGPVKFTGRHPNGRLNLGEDGKVYGDFTAIKPGSSLAAMGGRWTEYFPSANGFGAGSTIIWGVLKGETEEDCAPVMSGRHYHPWRATRKRAGGDPLPKKAA